MFAALLMLLLAGFAAVVAIGIIFAVAGIFLSIAFGITGFLLFKVAPVLLLGWIVVKLVQRGGRHDREISAADQRWLDG